MRHQAIDRDTLLNAALYTQPPIQPRPGFCHCHRDRNDREATGPTTGQPDRLRAKGSAAATRTRRSRFDLRRRSAKGACFYNAIAAFGAVARARQIIVVGDDKQLPPTNFFREPLPWLLSCYAARGIKGRGRHSLSAHAPHQVPPLSRRQTIPISVHALQKQ